MSFDSRAIRWLRDHHATVAPATLVEGEALLPTPIRKRLVADGTLRRLVDGAYVFDGIAEDELTRCAALCTSRVALVVAGPTAARIWELRRAPRDGLVHVIAPPQSNPCVAAWVKPYRTAAPAAEDVVRRPDGIRLTSPPRTVVDMTRYAPIRDVASMLEHVLERQMATVSTLCRVAGPLESHGRPWVRRFLQLLDERAPGAPAESDWEHRVHLALRCRGVADVVRQHRLVLPGYGPARFDLAIPALRWALEVDVHPEHRSLEGASRDNRRDAAADVAGWVVRRVAELQLTTAFERTLDAVVASIGRRRADAVRDRSV